MVAPSGAGFLVGRFTLAPFLVYLIRDRQGLQNHPACYVSGFCREKEEHGEMLHLLGLKMRFDGVLEIVAKGALELRDSGAMLRESI